MPNQSALSASGVYRDRNAARTGATSGATLVSQIKDRMPIVDVIGRYVQLKPAAGGKEFVGQCSFHEDGTASMYVSPGAGAFYCHGCPATGNVIHFVAHMNGVDYDTAKKDMGRELGLLFDKPLDPALRLLDATVDRYRSGLSRSTAAQEYLVTRGISVQSADKFGIGYCWGDEFAKATDEMAQSAVRAGLYSEKSGRSYLGGRITFPIRARDGRVIAFAGRVLERMAPASSDPLKKGPPKYLNTPGTEFFNKSEILYGMHEARPGISKSRKAVVVEGYLDVISLHQHGAENVVGVMGANANSKAFEGLWTVTDNIVFCLDGDAAGRSGTLRSIAAAAPPMKDTQSISVVFMPEGVDPDEFVKERGLLAFNKLVESAAPLSRYLVDQSTERFDLDIAEQRSAFLEDMANAAAMFPGAPALKAEIARQAEATCSAHVFKSALAGTGVVLDNQELAAAIRALQQLQVVQNPPAVIQLPRDMADATAPKPGAAIEPLVGIVPAPPVAVAVVATAQLPAINVSWTSAATTQSAPTGPPKRRALFRPTKGG